MEGRTYLNTWITGRHSERIRRESRFHTIGHDTINRYSRKTARISTMEIGKIEDRKSNQHRRRKQQNIAKIYIDGYIRKKEGDRNIPNVALASITNSLHAIQPSMSGGSIELTREEEYTNSSKSE